MSRERILEDIRAALPPPVELPSIGDLGVTFDDKRAKFAQMLEVVGGTSQIVSSLDEVAEILQEESQIGSKRLSFCPGLPSEGVEPDAGRRGHDYADLDLVVLEGVFGVAENAAVWVPAQAVDHPASLVLSQHLAIVIRASELVDNMHQAYARIGADGAIPHYGVFVAGPSKTADIEQSLVIGAHGARSLRVFIVEDTAPGQQRVPR